MTGQALQARLVPEFGERSSQRLLSHQSEGTTVFLSAKDSQNHSQKENNISLLFSCWTKEGGEGGGLGESFKIRYGLQPGVVAHAHNRG